MQLVNQDIVYFIDDSWLNTCIIINCAMALRDLRTVQKPLRKNSKNTASIMQEKDASRESSTSHQSCSNITFHIVFKKRKKIFFFFRE